MQLINIGQREAVGLVGRDFRNKTNVAVPTGTYRYIIRTVDSTTGILNIVASKNCVVHSPETDNVAPDRRKNFHVYQKTA